MSKLFKLLGWKPWTLCSNYDMSGCCTACPTCGSIDFEDQVTDTVANQVCEQYTYCRNCRRLVNFWAYGSYDPCSKFDDRSFEMWLTRMQYKLRGLSTP